MGRDYATIPQPVLIAMRGWLKAGIAPGSFLAEALRNDFVGAVCCADVRTLPALPAIALFLHNEFPAFAWGTIDKSRRFQRAMHLIASGETKCETCGKMLDSAEGLEDSDCAQDHLDVFEVKLLLSVGTAAEAIAKIEAMIVANDDFAGRNLYSQSTPKEGSDPR